MLLATKYYQVISVATLGSVKEGHLASAHEQFHLVTVPILRFSCFQASMVICL